MNEPPIVAGRGKLTPLDDYLSHQMPETFGSVYTSDPNFFERYYFGMINTGLSSFLMVTMAVYPNRGFKEAAVGFVHNGIERVVRSSTHLNADRFNTTIGPITVEVVEGLKRLRILVEPNQWGLSCDLTFEGRHFPHLETRNYVQTGTRVTQDYLRFTQLGRYSGTITTGGEQVDITPNSWLGQRDHSWGIRPSGPPDRNHAFAAQGLAATGWLWTWAPMQFRDFSLLWSVTEDGAGHLLKGAGAVLYPPGSPLEQIHAASFGHRLEFIPGTRKVRTGELSMVDETGKEWSVSMRPGVTFYMSTVGYGGPWAQGTYKGDGQVDGAVLDLSEPKVIGEIDGLVESACEFRCGDEVGYGAFEIMAIPPLSRYGFTRDHPAG